MQFPERNDSFDFVGALDQYSKYFRLEKGIDQHGKISGNKDFSIKPGEKLNLNIKGVSGQSGGTGGGFGNLKPLKALSKPGGQGSKPVAGFGLQNMAEGDLLQAKS